MIQVICSEINKEVSGLCAVSNPSILRKICKDDLSCFSWKAFEQELILRAPLLLKILQATVFNSAQERNKHKTTTSSHPGMLSAGAKLLSIHTQNMSALKKINSIILEKVASCVFPILLIALAIQSLTVQWIHFPRDLILIYSNGKLTCMMVLDLDLS